ncbi:MAG: hypothetical protein ACI399_02975 [Candidatus Cryptobacteroides sp.]
MNLTERELREFFHKNRPATSDEEAFLAGLDAKLNAIEDVRRLHEAGVADCRKTALAAFLCGMAAGVAAILFLIFNPVSLPTLLPSWSGFISAFVLQWESVISAVAAIAALVLGLIPWGKGRRSFSG